MLDRIFGQTLAKDSIAAGAPVPIKDDQFQQCEYSIDLLFPSRFVYSPEHIVTPKFQSHTLIMDSKAAQGSPSKTHMRWACPLGCEGGFINIPQTNEHLKKSHVMPKKGQDQGSITQEELDVVRETTKKYRLKSDRFKMQQIHTIFSKDDTPLDDLELHAATRDEIKRMSTACAQRKPGTEPIMATFKRLAASGSPNFANNFTADQKEYVMTQVCDLMPHFIRALGIEGILIPEDEGDIQSSPEEGQSTCMNPPPAGEASDSSAVNERNGLNEVPQADDGNIDGSTVVGSVGYAKSWNNMQLGHMLPDWQQNGPLNGMDVPSAGGYTTTTADWYPPGSFPHNFHPGQGPNLMASSQQRSPSNAMRFDDTITNRVWNPRVGPKYKGAYDIVADLEHDGRMDMGPEQ